MASQNSATQSCVISYLDLRKSIGYIAMALPFALVIGKWLYSGPGVEPSISDYYYTVMRDVFVGSLWAIGVFLLSYRGYDVIDDRAGNIACVCALGVSLFPTGRPGGSAFDGLIGHIHLTFAAALFATLAFFCLFQFTQTGRHDHMTREKLQRNKVYRICGWTIIACMLLIAVDFALLKNSAIVQGVHPVFLLETLMIETFGFSWFVKGGAIWKDTHAEDRPRRTIKTSSRLATGHVSQPAEAR